MTKQDTRLRTEHIAQWVSDDLINNIEKYFPDGKPSAQRFERMLNSQVQLNNQLAQLVVNDRPKLTDTVSPHGNRIVGNPDMCQLRVPGTHFELEYLVSINRGDGKSEHKRFTADQVTAEYGAGTLDRYWGELGEKNGTVLQRNGEIFAFSISRRGVRGALESGFEDVDVSGAYHVPDSGRGQPLTKQELSQMVFWHIQEQHGDVYFPEGFTETTDISQIDRLLDLHKHVSEQCAENMRKVMANPALLSEQVQVVNTVDMKDVLTPALDQQFSVVQMRGGKAVSREVLDVAQLGERFGEDPQMLESLSHGAYKFSSGDDSYWVTPHNEPIQDMQQNLSQDLSQVQRQQQAMKP